MIPLIFPWLVTRLIWCICKLTDFVDERTRDCSQPNDASHTIQFNVIHKGILPALQIINFTYHLTCWFCLYHASYTVNHSFFLNMYLSHGLSWEVWTNRPHQIEEGNNTARDIYLAKYKSLILNSLYKSETAKLWLNHTKMITNTERSRCLSSSFFFLNCLLGWFHGCSKN